MSSFSSSSSPDNTPNSLWTFSKAPLSFMALPTAAFLCFFVVIPEETSDSVVEYEEVEDKESCETSTWGFWGGHLCGPVITGIYSWGALVWQEWAGTTIVCNVVGRVLNLDGNVVNLEKRLEQGHEECIARAADVDLVGCAKI